jgi:hypothetical protein
MTAAISHEIRSRMDRALARNRAYRKDMAGGPRNGALYLAEILIETRLVLDDADGRQTNIKRLVAEVSPEWIGHSTALRLIHRIEAEGLVMLETDPADGRSVVVRCTEELRARNTERWAKVAD